MKIQVLVGEVCQHGGVDLDRVELVERQAVGTRFHHRVGTALLPDCPQHALQVGRVLGGEARLVGKLPPAVVKGNRGDHAGGMSALAQDVTDQGRCGALPIGAGNTDDAKLS